VNQELPEKNGTGTDDLCIAAAVPSAKRRTGACRHHIVGGFTTETQSYRRRSSISGTDHEKFNIGRNAHISCAPVTYKRIQSADDSTVMSSRTSSFPLDITQEKVNKRIEIGGRQAVQQSVNYRRTNYGENDESAFVDIRRTVESSRSSVPIQGREQALVQVVASGVCHTDGACGGWRLAIKTNSSLLSRTRGRGLCGISWVREWTRLKEATASGSHGCTVACGHVNFVLPAGKLCVCLSRCQAIP